ncbi:hypothetical protein BU26DRAFT_516034 [Trematosphaeria pertusa]|uniref:Uncharacterized protein n=1 Tax=Trematosphaeria pertusa TaxID=390896 RepID=A0A6A6IT99_9PLEO|nr:uncharacterized protein BU26DRAFT_516034 [Trematosphaeria pertusa]KAF2253731.1 hypothetical protein BU26DRAFT_516034 [Trematosphaeria pertusa]
MSLITPLVAVAYVPDSSKPPQSCCKKANHSICSSVSPSRFPFLLSAHNAPTSLSAPATQSQSPNPLPSASARIP